MSISDLRRDAEAVRLSRKRDIHGRHKELLTELFYFTKHPEIPPDSESTLENALAESSDLITFLNSSDLNSGRFFQESMLPKIQTVPVNTSTGVTAIETNTAVEPSAPPVTPQTVYPPSQPVSTGSGRMVTRVSSGAIRHKSVGELLGEKDFTPKSTPTRTNDISRDVAAIESLAAGFQENSNVAKPSNNFPTRTRGTVFQDSAYSTVASNKVDLDRLQAAVEIFPLEHVVTKMAHKSVRTSDWASAIDEKKTAAICARISELKEQNLWSLRQPVKQKTPSRLNTHWDYMLREMEWMSTDFYEERKFKMAGAFLLAKACQRYHESTDRKGLLHKWPRRMRTPVKHFEEETDADEDVLMVNHRGSASPLSIDHTLEPMTDVNTTNNDIPKASATSLKTSQEPQEPERETLPTPSPSSSELDDLPAIFDLPSDVIYASVNELPKKDGSSLSQLPIYAPPTLTEESYHNPIEELPIVPISKYCLERYVVPVGNWEPPNGRYRLSTPEHPDDVLEISKEVQVEAVPTFAPAGTDLVNRRRTSAIIIRPPPPPTHWTDQRPPPWTPEEERQLLQSAKDNLYNFDLVAATLSFPGSSVSDLEKRSAWECFEKFRAIYPEPQNIQIVGPNRNAALNRLEKVNRLSVSSMNRPKPNMIVRAPRLEVRNHRYLNLFDAMKKSAKNREKSRSQEKPPVKKTKDNLPTKAAVNVPTPLDLSRLKAERDRAFNQAMMAERQAQAVRLQMPANASPEVQDEVRRQWYAQQQALLAANAQGLRQNPGLGRGLVIPGGPNIRQMPIRPNTGANSIPPTGPMRLPNGTTATPEQVQQIIKARQQLALANRQNSAGNPILQHQAQVQAQVRLQQAQLNAAAAQSAGQTPTNGGSDYIPFAAQTNGTNGQGPSQVANLVQSNRLMQPPQSGAVAQGIRQGTPQQQLQLPQQGAQGLRATPPRPSNLSPTGAHFAAVPNTLNLQAVTQIVQQNNPQLSVSEATKLAVEQISRFNSLQQESMRNQSANGLMQQHLQQQLAKSSPTPANQQIRRSPSQNTNTPHPQSQQRMS